MDAFEPLIGSWHGSGSVPSDPPLEMSAEATIERLGPFLVFRSIGEPAELPDTLSIIGGAPTASLSRCTTSMIAGSDGSS